MTHPKTRVRVERERPPDPVRTIASRLFAQHEAELMAQLHAFVQTQKERLDPPPPSLIVEAEVRVIEEEWPSSNGPIQAKTSPSPQNRVHFKQMDADFRAWQAAVFET